MKATAIANSNIALTKYWGKRDSRLFLPMNSSISMTLDKLFTKTTVEFSEKYSIDEFWLDGKRFDSGEEFIEVKRFLDLLRKKFDSKLNARIFSKNNFPTAAGLASSASGFAALALAGATALGKNLSAKELSIIARQGSGSACRSCDGGFVEWLKGKKADGSDSYAKQIALPEHWKDFRMIATIVSTAAKKIKSRTGMAQTVSNCPLYNGWIESIELDNIGMRKGILEKNFSTVGKIAEHNCLKMHATMISTKPPMVYWQPATISIIHEIFSMRKEGIEAYFTIDAGPQVKVLCLEKNCKKIEKRLNEIGGVKETHACKAGGKPKLETKHLF